MFDPDAFVAATADQLGPIPSDPQAKQAWFAAFADLAYEAGRLAEYEPYPVAAE
jgi:hypothetical protein